ncbi:SpoIIE family protein phosphatase [Streptomyces sp. NBC_00335]|uniref:SpoIIE family protein phosphatase n=1 Tax=unclassified Streptomyces TaxID=2593676 RepID=UPI002256168A|nr:MULTISPECIES: SpoIIE family protein phosphatase [unclassified Streptomyces]MCX5408793.1 SpoIIE family protein phosphatase [Streptomyces sp. NBC_00086]
MEQLPTPPGERPARTTHASPGAAYTATATVSEQGIVTGWSEDARRLLGYLASEVVGMPAADLLADRPGDTAGSGGTGTAARPVAPGQERWSGTAALRHRDGRRLDTGLLAHRRTADGGTAEWLVVSAVAGAAAASWDGPLGEWAFDRSPCVLAVFDEDLRLVRANTGMHHALSLTEAEMRGLRLSEIAPGPVSEEVERGMRRALETGEPQSVDGFVRPPGAGSANGWATTLAPVPGPDGRARAVYLSAHDKAAGETAPRKPLPPTLAGARIDTVPDSARTAQELADAAVPRLADFAVVDLLEPSPRGGAPSPGPGTGALTVSRSAVRSVLGGSQESRFAVGETAVYPALSPPVECLAAGRGAVYGTADPAVARWVAQDPGAAWIGEYGTHSIMLVPLRDGAITLGLAVFSRHQRREPFDPEDLRLAEELAARAATGIHRARRTAREHTSTMTLQRSLLPHTLPVQSALEIASRYLPSGGEAGVGGDWFDVIPLSGARVALVVGDVVGHGMRASATMGRLRTAVRTLADVDLPPDELLTHLDDLIIHLSADETGQESSGGIGTTCLYVVYDPVTRVCTAARAGHPPPAVVSPEGSAYLLDVPAGPPLGLGGLPFETVEVELPEGSLLALYTDGLLQARDHDIDEALDSMLAALIQPASTLDTVCDRVLTALLTHRPEDDVALLVARTRALHTDKVAVWDLPADPSFVAQARRGATDQLTAWGLDEAAFVTELVVSELVTNAIRYGEAPIQLRLIHEGTTLICEVSDASGTAPHMRRARIFDEGGRGLLLVAQLTQRWGTRHTLFGKTIWAEQSLVGF